MSTKTNKMKQKIFFFTIILILSFGCRSKKTITEYKDRVKIDTVYTTKTIKEVERYTDTLTIENPCDSVTGNLKPFKQLLKVKQGNILLEGKNNVISAEIDLKGYKNTLERTYQAKYDKEIEKYKENNKVYITPWYHWLIHILCALVIFLLLRIRF